MAGQVRMVKVTRSAARPLYLYADRDGDGHTDNDNDGYLTGVLEALQLVSRQPRRVINHRMTNTGTVQVRQALGGLAA